MDVSELNGQVLKVFANACTNESDRVVIEVSDGGIVVVPFVLKSGTVLLFSGWTVVKVFDESCVLERRKGSESILIAQRINYHYPYMRVRGQVL